MALDFRPFSNAPRGIQNNNPGNIEFVSANDWAGKVPAHLNTDPRFEQFQTFGDGVRAMMNLLITYYTRDNLQTLDEIIRKWAPVSDNSPTKTTNYVDFVSQKTGIDKNAKFDLNAENLGEIAWAMTLHENGPSQAKQFLDKQDVTLQTMNVNFPKKMGGQKALAGWMPTVILITGAGTLLKILND